MILVARTKIELGVRRPFEVEEFVMVDRAIVRSYSTNSPQRNVIVLTSVYVGADDLLDGEERDAILVSPAGIEVPVIYGTRVAVYGYHTGTVVPGLRVEEDEEFGMFTFALRLFG